MRGVVVRGAKSQPHDPDTPANSTANEVSGTVHGPVVQAGVIHGGVYLHHTDAGPPSTIPRQLIAPPATFTNRLTELDRLDSLLGPTEHRRGPPTVVVCGPGGVGKTALALQWSAGSGDRFCGGHLFADLDGVGHTDTVSVIEVLGNFLRALGIEPWHVPMETEQRAALFRSLTASRAILVLLDNAFSTSQVRALTPASPTSAVLVTSRHRLVGLVAHGARIVDLAPLDQQAGVELLSRSIGRERIRQEPEPAKTLVGLCGGLPIAVCVAAARLATRPRWSLERVVRDLRDERTRLTALSAGTDLSVRAVFDLSYRELPDAAARLYRLLGLHPGDTFGSTIAAAGAELGRAETDGLLDTLVGGSLLAEVDEDRYRFHELVRVHAHELAEAEDPPRTRSLALRRMLECYLRTAHTAYSVLMPSRRFAYYEFLSAGAAPTVEDTVTGASDALRWLERERDNLVAGVRRAHREGWSPLTWQLANALRPLLLRHKDYLVALDIEQIGLQAARTWGHRDACRSMLKRLARTCSQLGRHEQAGKYAAEALGMAVEDGDERGIASARKALALLLADIGRHEDAVRLLTQAAAAYEALGRVRSHALSLIALGTSLTAQHRADRALAHIETAHDLLDSLQENDHYNCGRALIALGNARTAVGDHPGAHRVLEQAAEIMTRLDSPYEQAHVRDALGDLALAEGDTTAADRHYAAAVALFSGLGSARAAAVHAKHADLQSGRVTLSEDTDDNPPPGEA